MWATAISFPNVVPSHKILTNLPNQLVKCLLNTSQAITIQLNHNAHVHHVDRDWVNFCAAATCPMAFVAIFLKELASNDYITNLV